MTDETLNDCIDAAHSTLAEENQRLREEVAKLRGALESIVEWRMPHLVEWMTGKPQSFAWLRGSRGEQEIIRERAWAALYAPTRPADADPDISGVPV